MCKSESSYTPVSGPGNRVPEASLVSTRLTNFRPLSRVRESLRASTLDRRLAAGADPTEDPALTQRARQLTSEQTREELANWIESLIDVADRPSRRRRPAVVLERVAIREARPQLQSLARDLAKVEEPASARGIARTRQLLTDGGSPLYACPGHACAKDGASLEQAVRHVRASLALD
jgi:hypothetical protein